MTRTDVPPDRPSRLFVEMIRAGWLPMGIYRVDRPDICLVGYRAAFTSSGKRYARFFGDVYWGGARKALLVAAAWIEQERARRLSPQKLRKLGNGAGSR